MEKKIIFSLILSFFMTFILVNALFFQGSPKVNIMKVKRTIKKTADTITIFKNTLPYRLSGGKKDYDKILDYGTTSMEFEKAPVIDVPEKIPTPELTPVSNAIFQVTATPIPTLLPTQTLTPTPTEIILTVTDYVIPTKKLKSTPTPKPKKPTATPTEIPENEPALIGNPLDQPYYNPSLAYQCYNTERFIEVYGGGEDPGNCYSKVRSHVEANLTSVSIMGKSISVHKKAYPAFKAVADKLKNYRGYKINTIGAYIFRCNVNASTSNRNDLCNSGCVLSAHSFGIAVDINWDENCNGCENYDMPEGIVEAFEENGFRWGGRYKAVFGSTIDPMHFEYMYDLCKDVK